MSSTAKGKLQKYADTVSEIMEQYVASLANVQMKVSDCIEKNEALKTKQTREAFNLKKRVSKADLRKMEDERLMTTLRTFKQEVRAVQGLSSSTLLKCYSYWTEKLMTAIVKLGIDDADYLKKLSEIPLKLAALLLLNGDYYKAMVCLNNVVKISPDCSEARATRLKWAVYLGEWEVVETALTAEKKDLASRKMIESERQRVGGIARVAELICQFTRQQNNRNKFAREMIHLLDCARVSPDSNTYNSFESTAFLRRSCSYLGRIAKPTENTPDVLNCLEVAWQKYEIIMRNRLPGLSRDEQRIDFAAVFKSGVIALETCSAVSEDLDGCRDYIIEAFNAGLIRDAHQMSEYSYKIALKMGITFRIHQVLNLSLMLQSYVCSEDCVLSLPGTRERLRVLLDWGAWRPSGMVTRSRSASPARGRSKSPARCATPARLNTAAAQMLEAFAEITLAESVPADSLHCFNPKCGCETCFAYQNNFSASLEYHFSQFFYTSAEYTNKTMEVMHSSYLKIRESVMTEQQKALKTTARPRPPVALCEMFGLCAIRWLRSLELNGRVYQQDTQLANLRSDILEAVIKLSKYASIRCVCYNLAARQLVREDLYRGHSTLSFSWMDPSEDMVTKNKGITSGLLAIFHYFRKGDSRDSLSSKLELASSKPDAVSPIPPPDGVGDVTEDMKKAIAEALKEYEDFDHVLYRDWRYPLTTFLGRHSTDPYQAAMMWAESTVIGSRQHARLVMDKVKGFSFRNVGVFENCIKQIPRDFTIVHLATDADGTLHMIKLHSEKKPLILPIAHVSKVARVHDRIKSLLRLNDESGSTEKIKDATNVAKEFWVNRRRVEMYMKDSVKEVEKFLFRAFAPLLLPSRSLTTKGIKISTKLMKLSESDDGNQLEETVAQELVSLVDRVEVIQWNQLIVALGSYYRLGEQQTRDLQNEYLSLRKEVSAVGVFNKANPLYTFFIVCPELACFPFEAMDIFAGCPFVGRLVSIHALMGILKAAPQMPRRVEVENAYYILDPDNNLNATQKRMLQFINKYPWKGLVGSAPKPKELQAILKEKDMFFYFGHGSGSKHMQRRVVKESSCNAVAVLMGCGSVQLEHEGWGMDGRCSVYDYTIANCPAVVGCLWMVTDGEIDRFFMSLVELCFTSDANTTIDEGAPRLRVLMEAMQRARATCKLPYLTGAAVVSYGIPIVSSD